MNTLLSSCVSRALTVLGIGVYVAVAVTEWQLGSAYHTGLALTLAGLLFFTGRARLGGLGADAWRSAALAFAVNR
ncbi:hypothetical protein EHF33_15340 [Deinococcus psychrotolerans]|uniref:Uncharacterized protein n=1 Tax=Deinococcus psychrotolerans TaxID=2489213 RepID=A0A3G8YH13_9DEIO|nr:hypothetical protein [Deinococcus psychrotolerans]AZI44263.1 hypothetical protein EHF33_15340 [Deinococcus psychrotolerans]